MISKIKKPVSILLSVIMVFSLFTIVPFTASAAYWYSDLARGTLIQPGDTFSFEKIGSFKFADYNDPTIIHEVKGSDFSYNQATLSVTDGYYSFGSTKLLPTSVSPGGLLFADYDSTTKMATFGVQNITHSFDETTGTLTIGGSGVVPPNYAFTGSDVYGVVFTQSNLVKHLIIDATDMIAIKQDAFMAYTGGCVLEDVEINSTSSTPLIIERNAVFYESDNTVTLTVNAVELATVSSCPINNYSTPVNLIYNVEQPITFKKNALTDPWSDLTVTFPAGCKIFIPGGPQFTDSLLQEEYDSDAEYGYEEFFWNRHPDLVEGTDYVLGDARYEELTPLNASLVVGDNNTALFSAYTITDESVNGTVTASVNGTDVTEAAADADVLLTVAPDNGYQFKSISATYPKNKVEEFSDLVALMGDAVFSAADYAAHPDYTCKVNDGKFVVYDGDTSVAELSEANMTNAELGSAYFSAQCGGLNWSLYFRNGRITDIYVYDSDYNYIFSSADGSKSTGTLPPAVVNLTTVTEGSQYSLTMPKMPVTVTAEFEQAAPAPETFKAYVKTLNGETYTIENLTGETTVAQLKEIIADQTDIPATAQRLIFAGKEMLDDAKTLAEYNIVKESTIHLIMRGYTVTWLNYDNSELGTKTVQYGATPSYDGEDPTKADAVCCTFTFAGWNDGTTTYAPDALPAVNGDVTYTAVFTDAPKDGYYKATAGGHSVYSIVPLGENIDGGETYPEFFFDNETEVFRLTSLKNCKYYYYDENGTDLSASFVKSASGDYYVTVTQDPMPTIVLVKPVYKIQWNNWDDTPLSVLGTDVIHGETPVYEGETPTKDTGDGKTYAFTGWTPELAPATDNATYTATYTATAKHVHDGITFEKWTSDNSLPTEAGNYVLTSDVTLSGTWNVPSGTTNLCLNGHGILLSGNDVYIYVNKANLNVFDCKGSDTAHYITLEGWRGTSVSDIGTESTVDGNGNGTVKISGGYITGGNRITQFAFGGCLEVSANGNFAFNGGTIIGNKCADKGGAIYTDSSSTLTVNGGSIVYNSANWGGAVFSNGTTTINGGSISYNVANSGGGAIELEANTLNVFGGEIKYNRVLNQNGGMWKGGGIHAYASTLNIKGNVIISDNYQGSGAVANNLYLRSNNNIKVTLVGELSESAKIGVSMQSPGTFTNSADTSFNDPTKFFSDKSNYIVDKNAAGQLLLGAPRTVTWKMDDGSTIDTTTVANGTTPTHTAPTKPEDANNTYTFAGWKNGETTYAPDALPAVTGDVTYTAVFTATPKKLFVGNTITLNADIGVNFFINSAYADFAGAETATVVFTWDNGNCTKVVNLKELTKESGCYKATCDVVAAHMAHEIHAVVYLNGTALDETDDFSVQDYADKLYKNPEEYDTKGKPNQLKALAYALLNYGAMAQTVFDGNLKEHPALANTNVGAWSNDEYAAVTADLVESKINGSSSDLKAVAAQLGAKYFTNSLIYLSKNTLRIYFTPTSYPGEIPNADAYAGNLSGYYYYVDHADIKAAELDNQQTFNIAGTEFTFSALDYVVSVIGSNSMTDTQKNLAKSLFLYNQAANAYFD